MELNDCRTWWDRKLCQQTLSSQAVWVGGVYQTENKPTRVAIISQVEEINEHQLEGKSEQLSLNVEEREGWSLHHDHVYGTLCRIASLCIPGALEAKHIQYHRHHKRRRFFTSK